MYPYPTITVGSWENAGRWYEYCTDSSACTRTSDCTQWKICSYSTEVLYSYIPFTVLYCTGPEARPEGLVVKDCRAALLLSVANDTIPFNALLKRMYDTGFHERRAGNTAGE